MPNIHSFESISGNEAANLLRSEPNAVLFDVRDLTAYRAGHIEGAAHLSDERVFAWMKRIPKNGLVLIYCYHGNASKTFARTFADFGYSRAFSVDGGYPALQMAMNPSP